MVGKEKLIVTCLSILFLAISIMLLNVQTSKACHLGGPYMYYGSCEPGFLTCKLEFPVTVYEFQTDFGGCVMAYAVGPYYSYGWVGLVCICQGPEAKWYPSPSSDGQICKRRSGWFCDQNVKEGRWDSSESKCVICDGPREIEYFNCDRDSTGDYQCESACGADSACDERYPNSSLPDICSSTVLEKDRFCNSTCEYSSRRYYCSSANCGQNVSCGGQTYYCVYENGQWKWSTTKPSNFCCSGNDCPGYDPNTHLKLYCDPKTYTCKPIEKCESNSQCEPGWCCDTITGAWNCRTKGTILSSGGISYLCDPPEEGFIEVKEEIKQSSKNLSLFDTIINLFHFLLR